MLLFESRYIHLASESRFIPQCYKNEKHDNQNYIDESHKKLTEQGRRIPNPSRTTWPGFGSQVNHQGIGKQVAGYLQDETPLISYVVL